jgi:hypothetical protein
VTLERLVRFYRTSSDERSVIALLIANLIPLVGVAFFGWNLATILIIYWLENGIVGLWNVPRMALAGRQSVLGGRPTPSVAATPPRTTALLGSGCGSTAFIAFFVVHYGLFWFVHGVFVFAITSGFMSGFGPSFGPSFGPGFVTDPAIFSPDVVSVSTGPVWSQVGLAGLALFISHGLSFFLDYVRGGEYKTTSIAIQMFQPYGRVVVMHVTILLGAFLTFALGSPIGLLIVLVALKTALDLGLHARRHRPPSVSGVAGPIG